MRNYLHRKQHVAREESVLKQLKGARLLSATMNMRKYLNRLTSRGDLTQGEYQVLRHIRLASAGFPADGKPSPVRAATLSDKLELSRPSITRILNTLERRGFIIRKIDREDRRSISIELTEKGGEALDRANKALLAIAERLVDSLGDADTDKLIELVDKLAAIYKEMLDEKGAENGE